MLGTDVECDASGYNSPVDTTLTDNTLKLRYSVHTNWACPDSSLGISAKLIRFNDGNTRASGTAACHLSVDISYTSYVKFLGTQ